MLSEPNAEMNPSIDLQCHEFLCLCANSRDRVKGLLAQEKANFKLRKHFLFNNGRYVTKSAVPQYYTYYSLEHKEYSRLHNHQVHQQLNRKHNKELTYKRLVYEGQILKPKVAKPNTKIMDDFNKAYGIGKANVY